MQTKLTNGNLLNKKGELEQAGYATTQVRQYDRNAIKASKWRIKEWDYYLITNGRQAVALTIADNSYMSLVSASLLDFTAPTVGGEHFKTTSEMKFFTFGKLNLPANTNEGDVYYDSKRVKMHFIKEENRRQLVCVFDKFLGDKRFEANFVLTDFPRDEMVIATPFAEDKKAFYYNSKINCMTATGYCVLDGVRYEFDGKDSLGTLDWGRGVWTYKNTWYWSSLSTYVNGRKVGFNLGYGFGDTSAASENMIFVDGIAHKTEGVTFEIPLKEGKDDFLSPWRFTSTDGRVELTFTPVVDRADCTDVGVICSNQHQVFGYFSGTLTLDDGEKITLTNNLGFAEKVYNKW